MSITISDLSLVNEFVKIDSEFKKIKNSQTTGKDIITLKEISGPDPYDIALGPRPNSGASATVGVLDITFEGSTQSQIQAILRWRIMAGSVNNLATVGDFDFLTQSLNSDGYSKLPPNTVKYLSNIYNYSTTQTLYYKVFIYASSFGKLSVDRRNIW